MAIQYKNIRTMPDRVVPTFIQKAPKAVATGTPTPPPPAATPTPPPAGSPIRYMSLLNGGVGTVSPRVYGPPKPMRATVTPTRAMPVASATGPRATGTPTPPQHLTPTPAPVQTPRPTLPAAPSGMSLVGGGTRSWGYGPYAWQNTPSKKKKDEKTYYSMDENSRLPTPAPVQTPRPTLPAAQAAPESPQPNKTYKGQGMVGPEMAAAIIQQYGRNNGLEWSFLDDFLGKNTASGMAWKQNNRIGLPPPSDTMLPDRYYGLARRWYESYPELMRLTPDTRDFQFRRMAEQLLAADQKLVDENTYPYSYPGYWWGGGWGGGGGGGGWDDWSNYAQNPNYWYNALMNWRIR